MKAQEILDENIIHLLGLESLPDEEKGELVQKMSEVVQKNFMLRIMELLKSEDASKMAELEKRPIEEIFAFIAEKVPNYEELLKEEVMKLKQAKVQAAEEAA